MTTNIANENLGKALGQISSGLYVITVNTDAEPLGMLASWVMQSSFDPPGLTIALQPDRPLLGAIKTAGRFNVHPLSEDNRDLMKRFSTFKPDAFEALDWRAGVYGPVLNDALACLHCVLVDGGGASGDADHIVIRAKVEDGIHQHPEATAWTHTRKNGFHY